MDNYEKEILEMEKEEFFGEENYEPDLSVERNKRREKVRARRKASRAKRRTESPLASSMSFKISKRINALEDALKGFDRLTPSQEDKVVRELSTLYTAIENIIAVSHDKRKLKKMVLRYKNIV